MRIRAVVSALVISIAPSTLFADDKYTLEDLRALAENEGWSELLEHVEDIRPRDRKKEWKSLLEKAAIGHLDVLMAQKKRHEGLAASEQIITRFPILKKSRRFMEKRAEVGLLAFEECFADRHSGHRCSEDLMTFIKLDGDNTDLAFRAGKVVTDVGKLWAAGPQFFVRATPDKKKRRQRCKDEDLQYSTLASFGQPPKYDSAKAAMTIAFEHCYQEMRDVLLDKLYGSASYTSRNLCEGLKKRKAKLSGFQTAYCTDMLEKY